MNIIKKWLLVRANRRKSDEINRQALESQNEAILRDDLKKHVDEFKNSCGNVGLQFIGWSSINLERKTARFYGVNPRWQIIEININNNGGTSIEVLNHEHTN